MFVIEYVMREQGITQSKLASQTGIARSTVNRVLSGDLPPYPKYQRLFAEALNWKYEPIKLFENLKINGIPQHMNKTKCDGCGQIVDSGWLFFCDECANNGTWTKVMNKAVKDEKQKSGA